MIHDPTRPVTPARGFTLLELMIVIAIMAVVTSLVVPQLSNDDQLKLVAAASVVRSDLEMAQVMTISNPDEPVVIRFDPSGDRFWLAMASTPGVPVVRTDTGEAYLTIFGHGRAIAAAGVTATVADMTDHTLAFDSQGGVDPFTTSPTIKLMVEDRWLMLHIDSSTGSVTETGGGG
jgi:prepilin-type N-terminal cleavage/methylation domain-containing protein